MWSAPDLVFYFELFQHKCLIRSQDITMQQQISSNKTEANFVKFWLCYGLVGNISRTQICRAMNAHTQICCALDAHIQICWASNAHICMGDNNFLWLLCWMFLSLSSFPCIHSHLREAKCLCANNYSTTWNLLSKSNYLWSCMRHSCMLLEMNLCMYFKLAFCPIFEAGYSHCLVHVHAGKKQAQLKNPMLPVSRVSFSKYLKSLK